MTPFDLEIAARTVWMEARGESSDGRLAVAFAIVNRFRAARWYSGQTLAETCLKPLQFSCWNASDPNRVAMARVADTDPILIEARKFIAGACDGSFVDPTHGATHYVNPRLAAPFWAKNLVPVVSIGNHAFYKGIA